MSSQRVQHRNALVWVAAMVAVGALLSSIGSAQELRWNREVKNVALTRSPGAAPDSFFDVWVEWSIGAHGADPMTFPQNMDTEMHILINGTVFQILTFPAQIDPLSGQCFDCNDACGGLSCGSMNGGQDALECNVDADCDLPGVICECPGGGNGPDCVCEGTPGSCFPDCAPDLPIATVPLNTGDEIMVLLMPSPGALPDFDPSDDVKIARLTDDMGVFWNRHIQAVELVPVAGDNFFDVFIELEIGTHGIADPVDLSTIVEVQVNGSPIHEVPLTIFQYPTPCDQVAPPPAGDCSSSTSCGFVGGGTGQMLECEAQCLDESQGGSYPCFYCECQSVNAMTLPVGPLEPDDELIVILRPVPGALPELPGFPNDDEEQGVIPGSCDSAMDCADLDADGIRDSNCVWWECDSTGTCNATMVPYADMGGPNGACPPDLATDSNDRFHALNCFSNQTTLGAPPYPCEPNSPQAANVDAAGLGTPCQPDGVCDASDAFAALNAFSGNTTCSCAVGPAPAGAAEPRVVDSASIVLLPRRSHIHVGERVEIDAFLFNAVKDLRGYQLHLGTLAGDAGLVLVDMYIDDDLEPALPDADRWQAFNVDTSQMLAGRDGAGQATGDMSYLATFSYEATSKTGGTYVITALADGSDPTQRTFLFPTDAGGTIGVRSTTPARIVVQSARAVVR